MGKTPDYQKKANINYRQRKTADGYKRIEFLVKGWKPEWRQLVIDFINKLKGEENDK